MVEKSSAWKLPPNIYRLKDNFLEVGKRQMGKLGPYQCFTVERDVKTVRTHFAVKPAEENVDIFYDLPSLMDEIMKASNRNKAKFLKSERFEKVEGLIVPPPTKYYPQNFVLKPTAAKKTDDDKQPLFYHSNSTVPIKEMSFNKESFFKPAPGRYDPHDVTCKCYQTKDNRKCPGKISGDGHCHVFDSTEFRLVHPVKITRCRTLSEPSETDKIFRFPRPPREPISFRLKRSISSDNLSREIRYNTMVKKRNLFSVKTGQPVAFLTAAPRFKEKSEMTIRFEKEKKKMMLALEEPTKPQRKPMTKERLEELATPKNPLPKIAPKKVEVFEKLPNLSTENLVKKPSVVKFDLSRMSEIALEKQAVESSA